MFLINRNIDRSRHLQMASLANVFHYIVCNHYELMLDNGSRLYHLEKRWQSSLIPTNSSDNHAGSQDFDGED